MNFLQTHPETARWWQQREKCRGCEYVRIDDTTSAWHCTANGEPAPFAIDARLPHGDCGPDADLFKPR